MLYYFQQGDILQRASIIDKLTSLSEAELSNLIKEAGIEPENINFDKSTHSYSFHKIDDLSVGADDPK